jgi:ParB family chromosome partitioning protein
MAEKQIKVRRMNEADASGNKTRAGSAFLKDLYTSARSTAQTTHSNLSNRTTLLVNYVPIDKVDASELQVRSHFDDKEIEGLAHSIKQHGILQPILTVQDGDRYKVIAGERRLRAAKLAGLDRVPARVLTTDDKSTHEIALRENLDRVDLHPIEEGEAYLSLLEAKAYQSHESIAKGFFKPKSRITECLGYTKLPDITKGLLFKTNMKNRSLLRRLLKTPPELHTKLIEDAVRAEAKADDSSDKLGLISNLKATVPPPKQKALAGPVLSFQVSKESIAIPGFRWKAGEGRSRLEALAKELKTLLKQVENLL